MPHSGGGGSHGGGSHGGSHSSGGSRSSKPRISNSYFSGSNRYVYYLNNRPHYYYAQRPYKANEEAKTLLIFGIVWLVFSTVLVMAFVKIDNGGKLPLDYDNEIVIDDEAYMIDDKERLVEYLEDFQEKSGVTVGVVTRNSYDTYLGDDCELQSYNCYVTMWDDESHWLIYYVGDEKDRSDNWEWNLMCGDDCVRVLSYAQEDKFTEKFHRYLVASSRYSFEDCIIKSLSELQIDTGKKLVYRDGVSVNGVSSGGEKVSILSGIFLSIFPIIGLIFISLGIGMLMKKKSQEQIAKENAYRMPSATAGVVEETCKYCDGVYIVGTVISCPHCGAPIVAHNNP
ncbi:MAG: hypothetical protein SPF70_01365 [Lachnospiraceae bacterium]|nr:hypothetical protein [Lachnospiraceae bacterium]